MIIDVPASFTLQELKAYLQGEEDAPAPEGYRTTAEWAIHYDVSVATMRKVLQEAKAADKLLTRWTKMERLDGIMQKRAVHAFVGPSEHRGEAGDLSGDS